MPIRSFAFPVIVVGLLIGLRVFDGVLLFHTLAELMSVFVGLLMIVVVANTRSFIKNDLLLFLAISYCGVSVIDLMHAFTVTGMPFDYAKTPETTVKLWMFARFFEASALLFAPLLIRRRLNQPLAIIAAVAMIIASAKASFFVEYPKMFADGGLSIYKVAGEYVIMTMMALAMILLARKRALIAPRVYQNLQAAIALKIIAEFCFTLYSDFHGAAFVFGHLLKFVSFWLIYIAIIKTALKQPIQLLSQQSNSYDAIPTSAIKIDSEGVISQVNRAVLKEFSFSRDVLMYKHVHQFFHPKSTDGKCKYCEAIKTHQKVSNEEVFLEQYQNWYLVSLASVDKNNKHGGMILSLTNISKQKSHEQQLERHQRDLEQTVKSRTKELQESFDTLTTTQEKLLESKKMAALGGLVAGVAHEINTPIGVSLTAASYLDLRTKELDEKSKAQKMTRKEFDGYMTQAVESSELIMNNLQRAAGLIGSFKQVAVDQSSEAARLFKMKAYVQEVLTSLQPTMRKRPIDIEFFTEDDFDVLSSPSAVSQIVTNLVMNSLNHAFEPQQSGKISLVIKLDNDTVHFKFRDTGKGINKQHLSKIYDPFFTTTRGKGGSGLGMHIIFNLVNHTLCGHIECQSTVGEGTSFDISFPRYLDSKT
ncbi:ATP-binding protein [Psychrobium sp. MM17-31]|uniref:MASE3 domain-containing protein n=1 Tax=Psychrobium sp. MM17-31 TaxID=2917758 RepID=UPI001EF4A84A|nr:ATP-binding protein [Psychrobium sp. MM17-31]